jgi:hypothetical protein
MIFHGPELRSGPSDSPSPGSGGCH